MLKLNFLKKEKPFLESLLGYRTKSVVYKTALIHKSSNSKKNNERLEFLEDAVLSLIIAQLLFLDNKNKKEGSLSQKRAKIVSRKHLNLVGKKIIPKNKIQHKLSQLPPSVFGNTLESIIGAIYVDRGISQAISFIKKHIYKSDFLREFTDVDFKTQLLNLSQKEGLKVEYKTEKKEGLDHQKNFFISLFVDGKKRAFAKAKSKKEAEQAAAKMAMKNLLLPQWKNTTH